MKRKILSIVYFLAACSYSQGSCAEDSSKLQENSFLFANDLYNTLDLTKNVVISPYSVYSCLSMLYSGAEGTTKEGMKKVLHIPCEDKDFFTLSQTLNRQLLTNEKTLSVANGLWVEKENDFLPSFLENLQRNFLSTPYQIDFSDSAKAIETVNNWVVEKTLGKIPSLFQQGDINQNTRLVVVNTIYCQIQWMTPFAKEHTSPAPFYQNAGQVLVPMMKKQSIRPYFEDSELQGVILSGKQSNQQLDFVVLLPKEGQSLEKFEKSLSSQKINEILAASKYTPVQLELPKFCLTTKLDVEKPLCMLGMEEAFTDKANFSLMNGKQNLCVQKIVHQVFFDLNEDGLTAAAATGGSMGITSFQPIEERFVTFIANHPFLFLIIEKATGTLLFLGKYQGPTSS